MDAPFVERRRHLPRPARRDLIARRTRTAAIAAMIAAVFVACEGKAPTEVLPGAREAAPTSKVELEYLGKALGGDKPKETAGSYPGFDTYKYPGDDIMKKWLDAGPYRWVGFYLPAPCHSGSTWSGKRPTLEKMGWGLAVVYVGQQTWDRPVTSYETRYRTTTQVRNVRKRVKQTYRTKSGKRATRTVTQTVPQRVTVRTPYRVTIDPMTAPIDDCSNALVSGPRGRMEADDAIRRTEAEGFPRGSVIFLDIERMELMPPKMRDYYKEWTKRVLEDGRYVPGYYAHFHNASAIYHDVRAIFDAMGKRNLEPSFWISSAARAKAFSIEKAPEDVGHAFAHVWQGVIDVIEGRGGVRLPIDVNVARTPNPSRPAE